MAVMPAFIVVMTLAADLALATIPALPALPAVHAVLARLIMSETINLFDSGTLSTTVQPLRSRRPSVFPVSFSCSTQVRWKQMW